MSKPNEIMAAAERVYEKLGCGSIQDIGTIAGAIEAAVIGERKRCAKVAKDTLAGHKPAGINVPTGDDVAAAIMRGSNA